MEYCGALQGTTGHCWVLLGTAGYCWVLGAYWVNEEGVSQGTVGYCRVAWGNVDYGVLRVLGLLETHIASRSRELGASVNPPFAE